MLRAAEDVENALMVLAEQRGLAADLRAADRAQAQHQAATVAAFRAGAATALDIAAANRERLRVQSRSLDADRDAARAAVALIRALGT